MLVFISILAVHWHHVVTAPAPPPAARHRRRTVRDLRPSETKQSRPGRLLEAGGDWKLAAPARVGYVQPEILYQFPSFGGQWSSLRASLALLLFFVSSTLQLAFGTVTSGGSPAAKHAKKQYTILKTFRKKGLLFSREKRINPQPANALSSFVFVGLGASLTGRIQISSRSNIAIASKRIEH